MSDAVRDAREVQRRAAEPARSAVVEAAAGSGKTKVLVDRFLRLCLSGRGVDPHEVLAITFTRRATVEIQDRLQRAARRLATLEKAALDTALREILTRDPTPAERERAAWFHESLLEDPGGLGIDTLHAFCQKVLTRFAAEVGLDPRFAVLDERQDADYRAEALDRLEAELARDPVAAAAYARLATTVVGARGKVESLMQRRMQLQRWIDAVAPRTGPVAAALSRRLAPHGPAAMAQLRRSLLRGTPWQDDPHPEPARLAPDLAVALRRFAGEGLATVAAAEPDGPTASLEQQLALRRDAALAAAAALEGDPAAIGEVIDGLLGLLLTRGGNLIKMRWGSKQNAAERNARFAAAAEPVLSLLLLPRLLELLDHNGTLLQAGLRALDLHAELKRRDRVVDFQDLEDLALRLLTDEQVGPQVHFRLDARLDHLLLDEFQDTNRNQWELLKPLVLELLAGGDPPRTAFVVGDVKQSIYGFRGAEPGVFTEARRLFAELTGEDPVLRLPTNFRSLPAVVETVGELFAREPLRAFLGEEAAGASQEVAREVAPGSVLFVQPIDRADEQSGHERAAAAVAALVRQILDEDATTWSWNAEIGSDEPRALRRDDILILARTKTHLAAYEAALRRAGIPFLPAGRGLLARSREVQDLLALMRWLAHPADDTAGATVLRSPCFRLPEATVQQLLATRRRGRRRGLREVLREADDPALAPVAERLEGWFRLAGLLPLHDLLRRVVREGELLARFETAGGEQARFNLLRLFDLALAAEARGGSLRDFVAELEQAERLGGEEEGALPGESGTGRVRVMTVHGAKGLEAPVVILADAASPLRDATPVLPLEPPPADGPWLHDVRSQHHDGPERADGTRLDGPLAAPRRRALARDRAEEAHILYVALTRARDRLVVLGGRGDRDSGEGYLDWLAEATGDPGADPRWQEAADFLAGLPDPDAAGGDESPAAHARRALSRLRRWNPPPLVPRFVLEAPSSLDDDRAASPLRQLDPADHPDSAAAPPSRRDNEATRRGTRVHAWLERACRLGAYPPPPAAAPEREAWDEAHALWRDPDLGWVFRPEAEGGRGLSEVQVIHRRDHDPTDRRVAGFVDRLVLRPGRVDVVDYKSNRITPEQAAAMTEHYRPQLRAYGEALARVYPGREVLCWLLWTAPAMAGARLTEVTGP